MNTVNNKRRRESVQRIESAFMNLLEEKALHEISVSQLCQLSGVNRSTFYANFQDVYDLADKIRAKLQEDFSALFCDETSWSDNGALRMFIHIRNNQLLYKTIF